MLLVALLAVAAFPFWSPDGQRLGFFAEGRLKRVGLFEGKAQLVAEAPGARGGSWSAAEVIIFSPAPSHAIFPRPAGGWE